jgi:hypothetical protein
VHCSQHRGNFSFRLMLKGWRSGSASGRPWVQTPVPPKTTTK